ncbi:MAG: response regulator [Burkholderiaceae bacterium]|nr:response regulator [Burkholderiaceae bacterium]
MPLPHASRHTVLAVEDDDLIRSLLDDTLCDLGYRTITAANGQEALAALQAHQDIDLLVTDVRMPLLNGVDLVAQARQAQPGLSVIYVTGHVPENLLPRVRVDDKTVLVMKPFSMARFRETVIAMID